MDFLNFLVLRKLFKNLSVLRKLSFYEEIKKIYFLYNIFKKFCRFIKNFRFIVIFTNLKKISVYRKLFKN